MKPRDSLGVPSARMVGLADRILGALGGLVIALTLTSVRVWAWLSRTPYYKD